MNKTAKFFTVHVSVTVRGRAYRPGVCYALREADRAAIESMAAQGAASFFEKEVRVISGKTYPMGEGQRGKPASAVLPSLTDAAPPTPLSRQRLGGYAEPVLIRGGRR